MFLKMLLLYKYGALKAQNWLEICYICLQRARNLAINTIFTMIFFTCKISTPSTIVAKKDRFIFLPIILRWLPTYFSDSSICKDSVGSY